MISSIGIEMHVCWEVQSLKTKWIWLITCNPIWFLKMTFERWGFVCWKLELSIACQPGRLLVSSNTFWRYSLSFLEVYFEGSAIKWFCGYFHLSTFEQLVNCSVFFSVNAKWMISLLLFILKRFILSLVNWIWWQWMFILSFIKYNDLYLILRFE